MMLTRTPTFAPLASRTGRSLAVARATPDSKDSYEKLEAGVRDPVAGIENVGGEVKDRQYSGDAFVQQDKLNMDREKLGFAVGTMDAFRFKGSLPEVANARLAMIGTVAAAIGELKYGFPLFQQVQRYPGSIAFLVLTITVASLVPQWRGQPRKAAGIFEPNTELIVGRTAMMGFLIMLAASYNHGSILL